MLTKFTKKYIESLKPKQKRYFVWDSIVRGFGCVVHPTARKVYIYKYRNLEKKQVMLTFGKHGLLTVEMARNMAQKVVLKLSNGVDPQEEKKQQAQNKKKLILFKDFWKVFDERYIQHYHKPETIKRNKSRIKNYILPFFGEMILKDVSRTDILEFTNRLDHVKGTLRKCLRLLNCAFNQAGLWEFIEDGKNPVRGIPIEGDKKMERFLKDEERERLEAILLNRSLHRRRSPYAISAILMLLYTGCRRSEITTLRWENVHLKDQYLYFKDSKTGTKTVPLNPKAISVLEVVERKPDNPHVFCGKNPGTHIQEIRKAWEAVRKLADLEDVRLHDLRHSFASFALKQGVDLYTVSKLLGHKNIATTTRYAHLELDHLKAATNKIFS